MRDFTRRRSNAAFRILILWPVAAYVVSLPALAQPGGGPVPVVVAPVVQRELPVTMRVVGTVLPDQASTVASEVSGPVAAFDTDEGQYVKKGAVIAQVDPEVAQLRLAQARGLLNALQAELDELQAGTRTEELARLKSAFEEAQALFEKWEFERRRVESLFENQRASAKERHDTQMEYLAAKGRMAQARAAYEEAQAGPRQEVIARAQHDVAAQQAIVDQLTRDLEKTKIRAPFDGFLIEKQTEVGEWIEAGGPVVTMVALDTVKIRVDVPEQAIRYARAGAPATVEVPAIDETFQATITRIVPRAARAARTFPVEIELENSEHRILPGMFVRAVVPSGPTAKRLIVPKDAIVPQGTLKRISVVREMPDGSQMAMPLTVETGLEVDDAIQVKAEELQPGDRVVVRANERLMGPTPVAPSPQQASQATEAQPTKRD